MENRREITFSFFLLFISLILGVLAYRIARFFFAPFFWAFIISLAFYPVYRKVRQWVRGRESLAAFLMTAGVTLLVAAPTVLLLGIAAAESDDLYQHLTFLSRQGTLKAYLHPLDLPWVKEWIERLQATFQIDVYGFLQENITGSIAFLVNLLKGFLKSLYIIAVDFVFMVITLFFAFRDGGKFLLTCRDFIPMTGEFKERVFQRLQETVNGVMLGIVVTSLIQAFLATVGYWLFHIPYPLILGFLTFVAGLLGLAVLVWLPAVAYLLYSGQMVYGILLAGWEMLMFGLTDTLLRPMFISGRTHLHPLALLVFILGGLIQYGFLGLFLGPIILAVFITLLEILREKYYPAPPQVASNSEEPNT